MAERLASRIARFEDKTPDWHAFPANEGFPELDRAQYRFIGAGGSPKHDDPGTLPPEHFTLSLIYQEPGKYAAMHKHEIEEAFIVLQGVLTMTWDYDGRQIDFRLGPNDMIMNPPNRPHGFRNDGVEPVLMSIMVGSPRPLAPVYSAHPKDAGDATLHGQRADIPDEIARDLSRYIVRFRERPAGHDAAGFVRLPYIGQGGAPAGNYRDDLIHLPPGKGVQPYSRGCEDAYFVLDGWLTAGWEEDGRTVEQRLGPRDLLVTPAGQQRFFRNDGLTPVLFEMVVGTPHPEDVRFEPAG
ncbi:MAG: cupin domain-containing protein [Chloroflexi bacterium]|nr:cupin domain-containing protein [Chloroflexota bacterium]